MIWHFEITLEAESEEEAKAEFIQRIEEISQATQEDKDDFDPQHYGSFYEEIT
jgi:hypothetical protein